MEVSSSTSHVISKREQHRNPHNIRRIVDAVVKSYFKDLDSKLNDLKESLGKTQCDTASIKESKSLYVI